jgi:hypothetical protein
LRPQPGRAGVIGFGIHVQRWNIDK